MIGGVVIGCGLYYLPVKVGVIYQDWEWQYTYDRFVALQSVAVEAVIVETTAEVKITQRYVNNQSYPIESIYVFPLDDRAAVCEFEAVVGDRRIIGIAKPKQQARQEYQQAINRGDGAYLLEEDKPDIFRAKVGNILPGTEVSITIKYVAEIKNELDKIRFFIPTHIAPRYTPAYTLANQVVNAPASSPFANYKLGINVTCVSAGGISSIESPSHLIAANINGNMASIGLDAGVMSLDKDFVLLIGYSQPHEPKVVLEDNGKGSYAAMVSFFPNLAFAETKTELVFLIDRSGSMEPKERELREAMELFIRSLPANCFFNIVGFGSNYQTFFPNSKRYDDNTYNQALQHVAKLRADLGGTEIFQPLQAIFNMPAIPGYSRQIFVLTDGEISNTDQVIDLVKRNSSRARLFSLGIGNSVSHHLVEGIARAGKGTSFFAVEGERIEKKVLKQLKEATQPALENVKVDWGIPYANQEAPKPAGPPPGSMVLSLLNYTSPAVANPPKIISTLQQAPHKIPPIYDQTHFRVYSIFKCETLPTKVVITAVSPDGVMNAELPIDSSKIIQGKLLHTLAARTLIRDLEEDSSYLHIGNATPPAGVVQDEIIRLGTTYGLASKHTSFLAIEERAPQDKWYDCYTPWPRRVSVPVSVPSFGYYSNPNITLSASTGSYSAPPPAAYSARSSAFGSSSFSVLKRKSATSSNANVVYDAQVNSLSAKSESSGLVNGFMNLASSIPSALFGSSAPPPPPPTYSRYGSEEREKKFDDLMSFSPPPPAAPPATNKAFAYPFGAPPPPAGGNAFADPFAGLSSITSSPTSSANDPRGRLFDILKLQNSQGSFPLTSQLADLLKVSLATLQNQFNSQISVRIGDVHSQEIKEKVWATVLVLTCFKTQLSSLADEWEMVDNKSRRWLASLKIADLQAIFNLAESLL